MQVKLKFDPLWISIGDMTYNFATVNTRASRIWIPCLHGAMIFYDFAFETGDLTTTINTLLRALDEPFRISDINDEERILRTIEIFGALCT